jgi:hypothetical protein
MPVLCFTANNGFVDFDNADQFAELFICEASANPVAHAPSGFVGASPDHAMDLQGADTFLAGEHQVDDPKPLAERIFGVLKDGPDQHRKTVGRAFLGARVALPIENARAMLAHFWIAATWALDAFGRARQQSELFP